MNAEEREKGDINLLDIDKIIKDKSPGAYKFIPKFALKWLKRTVHQDALNKLISENSYGTSYDFAKGALDDFGVKRSVRGLENLPKDNKRVVFVANHPLGGLDGMAFLEAVYKQTGDLRFPVNDLLLNVPALNQVFLPINKHGSQSREAIKAIDDAFKSNLPILYFPAGLCSRKIKGQIVDLEWKKTFLTQAIKNERDIIPVHISGQNSNFFYNLSNIRKQIGLKFNIEMLFLVDEMVKQKSKELVITFGKPMAWDSFDKTKNVKEWVNFVKAKTYELI